MISVRCLGHIGTSVGREEMVIDADELEAGAVVDRVRALSMEANPGFTKYNTLLMVEDGEAFVPAGSTRILRTGERLVLIPFSHGG